MSCGGVLIWARTLNKWLTNKMSIKLGFLLCLAMSCNAAFGQGDDDLEKKMLNDCRRLAKELDESDMLRIDLNSIRALLTWHAACAERPPAGPGNVTALCEGKRVTSKGEEGVFFWQKSDHGKLNRGYFPCPAQAPEARHDPLKNK